MSARTRYARGARHLTDLIFGQEIQFIVVWTPATRIWIRDQESHEISVVWSGPSTSSQHQRVHIHVDHGPNDINSVVLGRDDFITIGVYLAGPEQEKIFMQGDAE